MEADVGVFNQSSNVVLRCIILGDEVAVGVERALWRDGALYVGLDSCRAACACGAADTLHTFFYHAKLVDKVHILMTCEKVDVVPWRALGRKTLAATSLGLSEQNTPTPSANYVNSLIPKVRASLNLHRSTAPVDRRCLKVLNLYPTCLVL